MYRLFQVFFFLCIRLSKFPSLSVGVQMYSLHDQYIAIRNSIRDDTSTQ